MLTYRTTEEHFEAFQDEARKWIAYFGLSEWEIVFRHREVDGRAMCDAHSEGHIAVLTLSSEWKTVEEPDEAGVRKSGFHEVCELLLMDDWFAATNTDLTPEQRERQLEKERHRIIRRLENSLYRQSKERA